MPLKIMTYNIHHGRGTDGQLNLRRIAELIAASDADLIGINEVDRHFGRRSDYVDQMKWMSEYLQLDYAFGPAITSNTNGEGNERAYGNGLLSRYPITHISNARFHFRFVEDRALLETTVHIDEKPVNVYVTHLSLDPVTHKRQTTFILNRVKQVNHPVILLGDWNMKPGANAWTRLTYHLIDAWQTMHEEPGFTYPSIAPRARLDYIFLSHHFYPVAAEVVHTVPKASDHLPVLVTVKTHFGDV